MDYEICDMPAAKEPFPIGFSFTPNNPEKLHKCFPRYCYCNNGKAGKLRGLPGKRKNQKISKFCMPVQKKNLAKISKIAHWARMAYFVTY